MKDSKNQWNGDEFTLDHDACYSIDFGFRVSVDHQTPVRVYVNNVGTDYIKIAVNPYIIQFHQFGRVCASAGDKISFRVTTGSYTLTNSGYHRLIIKELPDYEAIVKNLSDQKVKCQTKFLSADVLSSGDVSDLTFNNLTIGKKYKVFGSLMCFTTNFTDNVRSCAVQFLENGNRVEYARVEVFSSYLRQTMPINSIFTATGTIAKLNAITLDDQKLQPRDGTSQLTLCELPDTYVETTEF